MSDLLVDAAAQGLVVIPPRGAWFVYDWDRTAYPIGLHDNELDALRQVVGQGYGKVVFWAFGREWDQVKP